MSNGLKVALLALACFATSISEFAIVGMIDVVAKSAGVSVAMAGQLLTAFALSGGIGGAARLRRLDASGQQAGRVAVRPPHSPAVFALPHPIGHDDALAAIVTGLEVGMRLANAR